MRLVPRHRRRQRTADIPPRIAISQADIDADLEYRGEARRRGPASAAAARSRR